MTVRDHRAPGVPDRRGGLPGLLMGLTERARGEEKGLLAPALPPAPALTVPAPVLGTKARDAALAPTPATVPGSPAPANTAPPLPATAVGLRDSPMGALNPRDGATSKNCSRERPRACARRRAVAGDRGSRRVLPVEVFHAGLPVSIILGPPSNLDLVRGDMEEDAGGNLGGGQPWTVTKNNTRV